MVTYTSAFLAAANLLAVAQAAPAWPVCQVVVEVVSGPGIWVPSPDATASWSAWDPKATTVTVTTSTWETWDPTTTTTSTWGTWDPTTTTTSTWADWTGSDSVSASSTTTWSWSHPTFSTSSVTTTWTGTPTSTWTPTSTPTTTWTSTSSTTTTTTTTTTQSAPTCASSTYDFNTTPNGSCGCQFTVDCNVHASYGANTQFWEQTSGQLVDTLAECIEMCNNNSACQATVWSAQDPTDTQDYKRCWQISGLGADASTGFGQISRKGSCSGSCSSSYTS